MIAVPNFTPRVTWEMAPREEKASRPQASGIHSESILLFLSASFAKERTSCIESKLPGL
jgi:hypothetical protein